MVSPFLQYPILQDRLKHYYNLLQNENRALYKICKQIPVEFDYNAPTKKLWSLHKKIARKFHENEIKYESENKSPKEPQNSFLHLKVELSHRMLKVCEFCENICQVNRLEEKTGICGVGKDSYISSAFLHMGEEPPIVPSGTIFFTGCTFKCCFCQNYDISSAGKEKLLDSAGRPVSPQRIAEIAKLLYDKGALNINYVGGDPSPNLYQILSSLEYLQANVAQLWNSNLYNSLKALRLLNEVIDIWLPDFKYGNNQCGEELSGVKHYWDIITRNLQYIYHNSSKSIIIRHLVLPNHVECCSKPILTWIADNIPHVVVNLMDQYYPAYKVNDNKYAKINRRVSYQEMERVYSWAERLGIEYHSVS